MKQICRYILEQIQFVGNRIVPCGSIFWDHNNNIDKYWLKPNKTMESVDFDLYFKRRNEYIEMYKKGIEPEFCKDCSIYEPINYCNCETSLENYKFKKIHINHKTICSCRCIYCCLADNGNLGRFKIINQQKSYDIKPILTQIDQLKLIDSDTEIIIAGGECTEYPDELEYIVDYCKQHNCKILILTNGIIYNKTIEEVLRNSKSELDISLDSGTEQTYKKIKRVNAYDRVLSNLEKYSKATENNPYSKIRLKYIICPGINDNIKELKEFFNLANKYNIRYLRLSINRFWLMKNKDKRIPNSIKKVIKYFIRNNEYKHIYRDIDRNEIWIWWLDKILNNNYSIWEKLFNPLNFFWK